MFANVYIGMEESGARDKVRGGREGGGHQQITKHLSTSLRLGSSHGHIKYASLGVPIQ